MRQLFVVLSFIGAASLQAQRQLPTYLNPDAPVEARVKDALEQMTLEEKCRLVYAQSKFSSPGVPRLGIPELRYSDGPHGVRAEINWNDWGYSGWTSDSITAFPALTCLAATWNPELAGLYGLNVGEEARYRQKNVLLGPGCNIYRTPLNGRNFEYLGEDPYLASRMVVPYIQQLQLNGVGACIKHYILNDQEEFRGHVDVKVSDRAFYEIYFPPFKAAVQEGKVWSVMGSYNQYHNQHISHNELLINLRLKRELGFDGVVVSDWGATHDTREAALNGLDSEMGSYTNGLTTEATGFSYDNYYLGTAYYEMCLNDEVPESVIDDKAGRILRLLFRTEKSQNYEAPHGRLNTDEHLAVARQIGQEGIVLLKNDPFTSVPGSSGKVPLLPIRPENYNNILVVGENAIRSLCLGGGSSELKARTEISPLQGLRDRFGDEIIDYTMGYVSGGSYYGRVDQIPTAIYDSLRNEAVAKARKADLVIYIGGLNKNHFSDCEGGDRLTYDLDFHQNELIEALLSANPRMVCVIISGNAFAMPWLKRVPALVQDWYVGSMAGVALADVLSGDVNPSGKTIFSYPVSILDCPAHLFGRITYPGVSPSVLPADFKYGPGDTPSSSRLLSLVTNSNSMQMAAMRMDGKLFRLNNSTDPATHRGNGDEQVLYAEDILVGYRWHDFFKQNGVNTEHVLFPFGYGLSYTTFKYSKPTIFGSSVTVTITNTGKVSGKEVVQFYVGDEKSSVIRPRKELKYFEKVSLRAGESKTVSYTVRDEDLKFYDEKAHRWVLEPGTFKIYVASSSADIKGEVSLIR